MKRFAIAICVGFVGIAAIAHQPASAQTLTNEANRNVNREKVVGGASCKGCDLFQLDFSYQELPGRDFSGSRLRQADFSVATMDGAKFVNTNMSIVEAYGARFSNADFTGADLTDGSFVGAWLGGANLKGATLKDVNFAGAYLKTAKGLTQAQLSAACGDADTDLPAGLTIPACR